LSHFNLPTRAPARPREFRFLSPFRAGRDEWPPAYRTGVYATPDAIFRHFRRSAV
jgi:hypothetical protein